MRQQIGQAAEVQADTAGDTGDTMGALFADWHGEEKSDERGWNKTQSDSSGAVHPRGWRPVKRVSGFCQSLKRTPEKALAADGRERFSAQYARDSTALIGQ